MFDYSRNYSSKSHHVCCEDNPTNGLYDHCQSSDDLDLQSRSQVRLKHDFFLTFNISGKLDMTVDILCMVYLLMLVTMTLTLKQGHSGSAKDKNQC